MTNSAAHGVDGFDPKDWPFYWMTQTVGRYLQRLERELKGDGLDVSRWRVLMAVGDQTVGVSELAELAIVKLPTMMKIVQRMEAEGFVRCEARQTDGRFTDVSLTAAGKQARERTLAIAGKLYEVAFSGMENPERDRLNATLQGVFDRLGGG